MAACRRGTDTTMTAMDRRTTTQRASNNGVLQISLNEIQTECRRLDHMGDSPKTETYFTETTAPWRLFVPKRKAAIAVPRTPIDGCYHRLKKRINVEFSKSLTDFSQSGNQRGKEAVGHSLWEIDAAAGFKTKVEKKGLAQQVNNAYGIVHG